MAALCTFNSVTVPISHVDKIDAKAGYTFETTLRCRTATYSVITNLQALYGHIGTQVMASGKTRIQTTGGTKATLVLNGVTYLNCYIANMSDPREVARSLPFTEWEFTISFVQETV